MRLPKVPTLLLPIVTKKTPATNQTIRSTTQNCTIVGHMASVAMQNTPAKAAVYLPSDIVRSLPFGT